jgi:hypothetical protein
MRAGMVVVALGLSGCVGGDLIVGGDLGVADLSQKLDFVRGQGGELPDLAVLPDLVGYQPPADPYKEGTPRLSIGLFYEGGFSSQVALGDGSSFYVYPAGETLDIKSDSADKVEGYTSSALNVAGGLGWFGCGVQWTDPHDLSAYKALHLALKSSSSSMTDVVIGMNSPTMASPTAKLGARAYGYTNDGAWHSISIPLADFAKASPNSIDPKRVGAPLVLLNAGAVKNGDQVKVDDVYFE